MSDHETLFAGERWLAVIGSRGFDAATVEYALAERIGSFEVLVSGGARGVDRTAEIFAEKRGLHVVSYRPHGPDSWVDTSGPTAGQSGRSYFVSKWVDGEDTGAVCENGDPLRWPTFAEAAKARNWWIVGDASHVLACWDGFSPGTSHGIAAAARYGRVLRIWMDGDS